MRGPARGILGGKNGNLAELIISGKPILGLSKPQFSLKPGDWLRYKIQGGGGYQNPLDRDLRLVEEDVRNGLVSIEHARGDYGVVINGETLSVDEESTRERRESLKNKSKMDWKGD